RERRSGARRCVAPALTGEVGGELHEARTPAGAAVPATREHGEQVRGRGHGGLLGRRSCSQCAPAPAVAPGRCGGPTDRGDRGRAAGGVVGRVPARRGGHRGTAWQITRKVMSGASRTPLPTFTAPWRTA